MAIVAASGFALAFGLSSLDATAVAERFHATTPVRRVASFTLLVSALLGAFWLAVTAGALVSGRPPAMVTCWPRHGT